MKEFLSILFFFTASATCSEKISDTMPAPSANKYYYLALGDSYTIGESVKPEENFPNQVFRLIRDQHDGFQAPRIIARTGWTTDELETGIRDADLISPLGSRYDFVTLLIGVNDQYRGRSINNYKPAFEALLKRSIGFAGDRADRVVVLSIPDWGVTPFAVGSDREKIAKEIDAFNSANEEIARLYNIHYINITPWTREAATDPSLLAGDGLHPSAKEYKRWAEKVSAFFQSKF